MYESCNCLDEEDPNYKEYYACAIEITKIINAPKNFEKNEGDLIEISVENSPTIITLEDGTIIWNENER